MCWVPRSVYVELDKVTPDDQMICISCRNLWESLGGSRYDDHPIEWNEFDITTCVIVALGPILNRILGETCPPFVLYILNHDVLSLEN